MSVAALPQTKTCRDCGETKALSKFPRHGKSKDGGQRYKTFCKPCSVIRVREWRKANPDYDSEWRANNRKRVLDSSKKWYANNRERADERTRRWRAENPERAREIAAQAESKRRAAKASVSHEPYSRETIFVRYGGTCVYCPAAAEALDHVVPISAGGPDVEHNLLPACTSCNSSKGAKSLAEWALTFG